MLTEERLKEIITAYPSYISPVDLKTVKSGKIGWASIPPVNTDTARQFAYALLNKCDELDSSPITE